MYEAISIEDRNKPAVALCDRGFLADAGSAASSRGLPGLRNVAAIWDDPTTEDTQKQVAASMDDIVAALTRPLTREERSPAKEIPSPARILFKGNLEEVNRFFYRQGYTDGLPIIPPTEEAVAEMLTGTDLPPGHIVEKLIPRLGWATVEKIAINAVMAGALPTSMPLLIATLHACVDPRAHFGTYGVSTGSWAPCLIVNGPVRNDLRINSGTGALSPGNIANATIGRALGLMIKNIGGARPGIEDMGVLGNPMKYSTVVAENEEESPWEPLHVERGLKREDSAVTVFFPNSFNQSQAYRTDDEGILKGIIYNIPPEGRGLTCFVLIPAHARALASKGWTKKDITAFVCEYARAPLSHFPGGGGEGGSVSAGPAELPGIGQQDKLALRWKDMPEVSMSVFRSPEWLRVIVAGGMRGFIGMIRGGKTTGYDRWVTKKIELPANWDKLVEKYRSVVPAYIEY